MLTLLTLGLRKVGRYSHTYQQATALLFGLFVCLVGWLVGVLLLLLLLLLLFLFFFLRGFHRQGCPQTLFLRIFMSS